MYGKLMFFNVITIISLLINSSIPNVKANISPGSSQSTITNTYLASQDFNADWIAYIGTDYNVWLIHPDGSENIQITFDGNVEYPYRNPQWSQDGSKLGFIHSQNGIYVFDIEQQQIRLAVPINLTNGVYDWFQDSKYLLYGTPAIPITEVSDSGANCIVGFEDYAGIYSLNLSTGESTSFLDLNNSMPIRNFRTSPNGEDLILEFEILGYENEDNQYIVQVKNPKSLTKLESVQNDCAWSPDGTSVSCGSWKTDDIPVPEYSSLSIYSETGELISITPVRTGAYDSQPFWAPSGKKIGFNVSGSPYDFADGPCKGGKFPSQGNQIELVSIDTNERKWVADGVMGGWSPDSKNIILSSSEYIETSRVEISKGIWSVSGYSALYIYIIDTETLEKTFLVNGTNPVWQPKVQAPPISEWTDKKSQLIEDLEKIDIPTSLFTIPMQKAYDEGSAKELLMYITSSSETNSLADNEVNAFIRLVLEEQAQSIMLPAYAEITAFQSDTAADLFKVIMSFNRTAKLLSDACNGGTSILCATVMTEVTKILNNITSDLTFFICSKTLTPYSNIELANNACQIAIATIIDELGDGKSLRDLLLDQTIQIGLSSALIKQYLHESQTWLEKGVHTADLRNISNDEYQISGSYGQAEFKTYDLTSKAELHRSIAQERYKSFKKGADWMSIATDIADLGLLIDPTKIAISAYSKFAGLLSRFLQVSVDVYSLGKNGEEIECIEFLSKQANEIAFDADLVQSDCSISYIYNQDKHPLPTALQVKYSTSNNIPASLENARTEYILALDKMVAVLPGRDQINVQKTTNAFIQARDNLNQELSEIKAIVQTKEILEETQVALLGTITTFDIQNINIFLSIAEFSLSVDEGVIPVSDLDTLSEQVKSSLSKIVDLSGQLDLQPPEDTPILIIEGIEANQKGNSNLVASVLIKNIGVVEASNIRVQLDNGSTQSEETFLETIQPGDSTIAEISIGGTKSYFYTNLWTDDKLLLTEFTQLGTDAKNGKAWFWWLFGLGNLLFAGIAILFSFIINKKH